tara:strand:- start:14 stop:664 length:651 start_codon:yes stop_codon:yes gene_type:complete
LSNNYGLVRQHNLLSLKATTSQYNTFLDKNSFDKFLSYSNFKNESSINDLTLFNNVNNLGKVSENTTLSSFVNTESLNYFNKPSSTPFFSLFKSYPSLLSTSPNSNSLNYPLRKLFNSQLYNTYSKNLGLVKSASQTQNLTSLTSSSVENTFNNLDVNQKFLINHSSGQSILPSEQSLRQATNVSTNLKNLNLNDSNAQDFTGTSLTKAYNTSRSG